MCAKIVQYIPTFIFNVEVKQVISTFISAKPHGITSQDHNFNSRNYLPIVKGTGKPFPFQARIAQRVPGS